MKKVILLVLVTFFTTIACKNETKETKKAKKTEVKAANLKEVSFNVSGMTCEVGCARTIASKLSKQEGVVDAKVVFTDSIAKVKFDATKTDGKKLMAFVDGIGDNMYKTSIARPANCKCEGCKGSTECGPNCKNKCNTAKDEKKQ